MSRESQTHVYAAEKCLDVLSRVYADIDDVQFEVDDIVGSEFWHSLCPYVSSVKVLPLSTKRWGGAANIEKGYILIALKNQRVILHELAHISSGCDNHESVFIAHFLELVRHTMGFHAYGEFSYELRRRGL